MIPWGNPGFVLNGDMVVFAEHDPEIDGPPREGDPKTEKPPALADGTVPPPQE